MTYSLHFLSEVEEDVIGGYVWYEAKSPGLAEEFLRIFYACAKKIPMNPLLYPKSTGRSVAVYLEGFRTLFTLR